jgi:cytochrome c oxidase cbb3-type subunit 2
MALSIHTNAKLFMALAGGIYLILVVFVALLPAEAMRREYPPSEVPADPLVADGFAVYKSYGCFYCHTQQIRGDARLPADPDGRRPVLGADRRFGLDQPTTAEEYASDDPPLLGTERTGPDLTAVGTRMPDPQWHYWHLYDPRMVSPGSNMPALPWLFYVADAPRDPEDEEVAPFARLHLPQGKSLYATHEARALVEYLITRTRPESVR